MSKKDLELLEEAVGRASSDVRSLGPNLVRIGKNIGDMQVKIDNLTAKSDKLDLLFDRVKDVEELLRKIEAVLGNLGRNGQEIRKLNEEFGEILRSGICEITSHIEDLEFNTMKNASTELDDK